jgi:hypothetical protein
MRAPMPARTANDEPVRKSAADGLIASTHQEQAK